MKPTGIASLSAVGKRLHGWSAQPGNALLCAHVRTRAIIRRVATTCIFAICTSGVSSGKDVGNARQWHHYSSDFPREQHEVFATLDGTGPSTSEKARIYWAGEGQLHKVAGGLARAPLRDKKKGMKYESLCPPNSLPSKQSRCICRIGYGCTGSRHLCQVGKSNRKVQHRLEGWLIRRCPHCRCDPMECKAHRDSCDPNCQRAIGRTNGDQLSPERLRLELQFLSKVMCIITSSSSLKVMAAIKSWAENCDGLVVVTFQNNILMNKTSIQEQYPQARFLELPKVVGQTLGTDFGSNMAAWRFVQRIFAKDYRWFISVPDATLVIMANLKRYLSLLDYNPETKGSPIFAGHPVHLRTGLMVNALRAGVILNSQALGMLILSASEHATGSRLTFEPLECTALNATANASEFENLAAAYQNLRGSSHYASKDAKEDNNGEEEGPERTALDAVLFSSHMRTPTGLSTSASPQPPLSSLPSSGAAIAGAAETTGSASVPASMNVTKDAGAEEEDGGILPEPCHTWKWRERLSFDETMCDENEPGMPAEFCIALLLSSKGIRPHDTRDNSRAHRFHIFPANATALMPRWGKLSIEQRQKTEPYPNLPGIYGVSQQTIAMPVRQGVRHVGELQALTGFLEKLCYPLLISKSHDDEFGRMQRATEKEKLYGWLSARCTLAVGELLEDWIPPTTTTRTTTTNPALKPTLTKKLKLLKEPPPFNASKCRQVNWTNVNFTEASIDTTVYTIAELLPALKKLAQMGNFTLESKPAV